MSSDQALAHQILLNNQAHPHSYDISKLRQWLVDVRGGDCQLRGPGSLTWLPPELGGRPTLDHLTIASTRVQADHFGLFGRRYFGEVIKWLPFLTFTVSLGITRRNCFAYTVQKTYFLPEEGTTDFAIHSTAESIFSFGNKLISFVAAILILVPVIVLHFLQNANWRLLVIVIFTLVFTATLVVGTSAERAQIFAATAAFVAVQVVYVGNVLSAST